MNPSLVFLPSLLNLTSNVSDTASNVCSGLAEESIGVKVTKVILYSIIASVALVGNVLLIYVVYKNKELRKTVNVLIVNMAVSDLFLPVFLIPKSISEEIRGSNAFLVHGLSGLVLCKLLPFLADVSLAVSTQTLVLIAGERFIAVVYPMRVRLITSKFRSLCILSTWVIAFIIHSPYFYIFKLELEGGQAFCETNWEPISNQGTNNHYSITQFVMVVIFPFCLISILYAVVLYKLHTQDISIYETEATRRRQKQKQRKVLRMTLTILFAFALCWAPFNILQIMYFIDPGKRRQCNPSLIQFSAFAGIFATCYCTLNPCISFFYVRRYRQGLRSISLRSRGNNKTRSTQQRETML